MEKSQFVDVASRGWWLLSDDIDPYLRDPRDSLGASFAWSDPEWFKQAARLEEMWDFLERGHPLLLTERLDEASDTERRKAWIEAVIHARVPQVDGPAEVGSDPVGEEPQIPSTAPAAPTAPTAPSPPKRPSIFAKKTTDLADQEPALAATGAAPATGAGAPPPPPASALKPPPPANPNAAAKPASSSGSGGLLEGLKRGVGARKSRTGESSPTYVVDRGRVAVLLQQMLSEPGVLHLIPVSTVDEAYLENNWNTLTKGRQTVPDADQEQGFAKLIFAVLTDPDSSTMLGVSEGGREMPMEPYDVAELMSGLAEHVAQHINSAVDGAPVRIAGSITAMMGDPETFLADDIDLDYYDKKPNDPGAGERWDRAIAAFEKVPPYKCRFGALTMSGVTVEGTKRELAKCVWAGILTEHEFPMSIPVEMKNVSGEAWHQGLKEGRRRQVGEGDWLPMAQLYVDTVSRYVDLIVQARGMDELETPAEKAEAVNRAAKEKSLFLKMKSLEEQLGKDGLADARELAEKKLSSERYEIWLRVSEKESIIDFFA